MDQVGTALSPLLPTLTALVLGGAHGLLDVVCAQWLNSDRAPRLRHLALPLCFYSFPRQIGEALARNMPGLREVWWCQMLLGDCGEASVRASEPAAGPSLLSASRDCSQGPTVHVQLSHCRDLGDPCNDVVRSGEAQGAWNRSRCAAAAPAWEGPVAYLADESGSRSGESDG